MSWPETSTIGRERAVALVVCVLLIGCARRDDAGAPPPAPTAVTAPMSSIADFGGSARGNVVAEGGDANDGGNEGADRALALRAACATAAPLSGRSVGHTSVVFKLRLDGGIDAAYKPRSKPGGRRYRGEVAAYRLARSLSLESVPYATIRSFDHTALERAVGQEAVFAQVVGEGETDGGGAAEVRGALIPWIKGLEFARLDRPEEIAKWRAWLKADGALPHDQRALAAQISTMITFDFVTGNWDRWSGGNIGLQNGKLLYIDNDGAFFDPVPAREMKRGADFFEGLERFSRSFVAALRAVDLARAMGDEVPGEALLSPHVLAQTEARRKRALAAIDARIAKLGETAVLAFE